MRRDDEGALEPRSEEGAPAPRNDGAALEPRSEGALEPRSGGLGLDVGITPEGLTRWLAVFIVWLVAMSLVGYVSKYVLGHPRLWGVVRLFDLNGEATIPSFYSAVTLLLCALLLGVIGLSKRRRSERYATHWLVLAAIFVFLAFDEASGVHELTIAPLRTLLRTTSPYLHYTWIVLAIPLVAALGLIYLPFLRQLPSQTRRLFVGAAVLYVGGAAGMEAVQGRHVEFQGKENLAYWMITATEEVLEMGGILLFVQALVSYMSAHPGALRLRFAAGPRDAAAPAAPGASGHLGHDAGGQRP